MGVRIVSAVRLGDSFGSGEHVVTIGRTNLGSRTYGRGGSLYGSTARCRCGWRDKVNEPVSGSGGPKIKARAFTHLAEVGVMP